MTYLKPEDFQERFSLAIKEGELVLRDNLMKKSYDFHGALLQNYRGAEEDGVSPREVALEFRLSRS